jgi:Zn-dependent protease
MLRDRRAISVLSLLLSFGVQCHFTEPVSAAGIYFILAAHEAGHLVACRVFNVPALWPFFIPQLGALIILKEQPKNPYQEAWLGVSGPLAGLLATGAVHLLAFLTNSPALEFCAAAGYALHVFNLIPLGDLDGGHIAPLFGRWLWFLGGALQLALLVFYTELPWLALGFILFSLWNGCCRIWDWLTAEKGLPQQPCGCSWKAKVGMAALYGLAAFASILGLLSSL